MSTPASTEANGNDNGSTMSRNMARIKSICPSFLDLLTESDFRILDEIEIDADAAETKDTPSSVNGEIPVYWQHVHLMLTLRILMSRTSMELATAIWATPNSDGEQNTDIVHHEKVSPAQLSERLDLFRSLLEQLEYRIKVAEELGSAEDASAATSSNSGNGSCAFYPQSPAQLLARISQAYNLRPVEVRTLQFLVTAKIQPANCALFLVLPAEKDYYTCLPGSGNGFDDAMAFRSSTVRYATNGTAMDWELLTNDDHALCKDRLLVVDSDEYSDDSMVKVTTETVKVLMGWSMTSEDKLKLIGTKLLELSGREEPDYHGDKVEQDANFSANEAMSDQGDTVEDILSKLNNSGSDLLPSEKVCRGEGDDDDLLADLRGLATPGPDTVPLEGASSDVDVDGDERGEDNTKPRAFENELDYLHQYFEIVMHKVALSRQRTAKDLKNAALDENKPSWMRSAGEKSIKQRSIGEIAAKLRLAGRKMEKSLSLTKQQGVFYPRLELLAGQLQLDDFQKFVLVYLTGSMISPVFKSCIKGEDTYSDNKRVKVGDLLVGYFETFAQQVAARTYFYKSATLLQKGIIKAIQDYVLPPDLTDQYLRLDRRVLETIVGLDKESSEISQGSHLYEPKVSLDAVVLPEKLKDTITGSVTHFEAFQKYRKHHPEFEDAISYGVGLTLMFCGKSGTGKTMTANAIAANLGKRLLLVNFPLLNRSNQKDDSQDSKFQSIFREAELSDAIIFFDECESLFSRRSSGGSSDTTELLTELEKFEGIVFLATNRPYDLDEAMYRRINEVFEFKPPNYLERLQIWKLVTSHKAVPCDPAIDWESIALKYELTGGFIKNAVISALLDGVGRDPESPQITEADILNGCKKQVRGALQMFDFNERVIPKEGLNDLITSDSVIEKLNEIVSLEKARGILFGSWGFDDSMLARQGTTALFWGPSGTGRSRAAEALGFELGKPLKVVDLPRLLSGNKGGPDSDRGDQTVNTVFQEARLQDAVLVLDGFSLDIDQQTSNGSENDPYVLNAVVREMGRFPGVVIMMVDTIGSLDVFVSRIHKSLVKGLKFLVEFKMPSANKRQLLWEKLMPSALPVLSDIDYKKLAEESSGLSVSHISNVIYRAAAAAALRPKVKDRVVGMRDLYAAIKEEKTRGESSVDRFVKSQYI